MPKLITRTASAADAVSEAVSLLTELGEECREACDNMPESLQSTSRYDALSGSADVLECVEEPDASEGLPAAPVVWQEPRPTKRQPSRATRCAAAVAILEAVVAWCDEQCDALIQVPSDDDKPEDTAEEERLDALHEALTEYRDALQQIVDNAEGCEFPGMYG
jgi:hypothetical protein